MALSVAKEKAIADLINRLLAASRSPADLSGREAGALATSMWTLADLLPGVVERSSRFANHAALARSAAEVKAGKRGTWQQAHDKALSEFTAHLNRAILNEGRD